MTETLPAPCPQSEDHFSVYHVICVTWPPNTPGNLSVQPGWCLTSWSKPRGAQTRAGYSVSHSNALHRATFTRPTESTRPHQWRLTDYTQHADSALRLGGGCAVRAGVGKRCTGGCQDIPTFFRSFPLMWQSRLVPSKHMASRRPFPSILITWAYSGRHHEQRRVNPD